MALYFSPVWRTRLLASALIVAPIVSFFVVLNRSVTLVPLEGVDMACAVCNRKATRTLKVAADSLRVKGIYVYDRKKYPKAAPVWCDRHAPESAAENAGAAYLTAIGVFAVLAVAYKYLAPS